MPTDLAFLDLGSGGGFPAIPLAIASRETSRKFTLVEPIAKKASFLRTVARELSLPVSVHALRAEQSIRRETFDVITSRALADLTALCRLSRLLQLKAPVTCCTRVGITVKNLTRRLPISTSMW